MSVIGCGVSKEHTHGQVPGEHTVAVAWTPFNHTEKICTDLQGTKKEKENVAEALQNNGCPSGLLV